MSENASEKTTQSARWRRAVSIGALLVVGSMISFGVFMLVRKWENHFAYKEFDSRVSNYHKILNHGVGMSLHDIGSVSRYFNSIEIVHRKNFKDFVSPLVHSSDGRHRFHYVIWVPRVRDADRTIHEESAQMAGFSEY